MDESTNIEIRFNSQTAVTVLPDEIALIEACLPDLLRELMQDDETDDDRM